MNEYDITEKCLWFGMLIMLKIGLLVHLYQIPLQNVWYTAHNVHLLKQELWFILEKIFYALTCCSIYTFFGFVKLKQEAHGP